MNIAIVGLGIIGGSYCKALKSYTKHTVTGINRTEAVAQKALNAGAIDRIGTPESLAEQDIIILCMYPQACLDFLRENGKFIRSDAIVTDAAGIKRAICPEMQALAREYGFIFVGSHPIWAQAFSSRPAAHRARLSARWRRWRVPSAFAPSRSPRPRSTTA